MDLPAQSQVEGGREGTKSCPLCGSAGLTQLHDRVWRQPEGQVLQCTHCLLAFLDPTMTEDQERAFYQAYNKHVQARGVTLGTSAAEFHARSRPAALVRHQLVGSYFSPGARVLEIGASTGAFLELLTGCQVSAVEPASENRAYLGRCTDQVFADLAQVPEEPVFDVICLFHVFEHIRKPQPFLAQCRSRLKAGGILMLEVPHILDPLLTIYDLPEFKDFYFQPMHPYVYSRQALDLCCTHAGLQPERVLYQQRYGLDNHLSWLRFRRPGGDARMSELFGPNQEYVARLEANGQTDTLIYLARK